MSSPRCIFTQKDGSYYLASHPSYTRYAGLHIPLKTSQGWTMVKTMHSIGNDATFDKQMDVAHTPNGSVRYLPKHVVHYQGEPVDDIVLDCREIYDFSTKGRIYQIWQEDDCTIICYTKHEEDSQDSAVQTLHGQRYQIYTAILGATVTQSLWEKTTFTTETQRFAQPDAVYQFHLKLKPMSEVFMSSSFDKLEAIEQVKLAKQHFDLIVHTQNQHTQLITKVPSSIHESLAHEYTLTAKAFDELCVTPTDQAGIYAGLPWFYQFWARDELISVGGLLVQERFSQAIDILLRYTNAVLADGRVSNRYPYADLGSADGIGWLAKRWLDTITILEKRIFTYLSVQQLTHVLTCMIESSMHIEHIYERDGLIVNKALETWMDTSWEQDSREGYCIEIQALFLCQLRLINKLTRLTENPTDAHLSREENFRTQVVKRFLQNNTLADQLNLDFTARKTLRPNVFLAYYVYPWLLSKKQWKDVFDQVLAGCATPWGGISSIASTDPLFTPNYTGEKNQSYHRGDSWYFLNHICAITLLILDDEYYAQKIQAIMQATREELETHGTIAEVSSASKQESTGCFTQGWSLSTYLELLSLASLWLRK